MAHFGGHDWSSQESEDAVGLIHPVASRAHEFLEKARPLRTELDKALGELAAERPDQSP